MKLARFMKPALGLASLFPLCLMASGQFLRVGISDSIPMGKLETMDSALEIADSAPKLDLLKRLGIEAPVAEAVTSPRSSHEIEIKPLRTNSGRLYGIVSLPCGIQMQAFLYLLDEAGSNSWHVVDHIAMDCFHGTPTYQLLSLAPGEDSIFVHHSHYGHGQTEIEDKTAIYIIRNNKMRQVLSTFDYTSQSNISDDSPPVEQKSFFLQISNHVIEETRITSREDSLLRAERRIWRWEAKKEAFSATAFQIVQE